MVRPYQHQRVDAPLDNGTQKLDFPFRLVFVTGHQQLVAIAPQRLLKRVDRDSKDRVAQRRVDRRHGASAARCQCLRGAIADVAQLRNRLPHVGKRGATSGSHG